MTVAAPESVFARATRDIPLTAPTDTAEQVRGNVMGRRFERLTAIPVCLDQDLVGMLSIERLLAAAGSHPLAAAGSHP